MFHRVTGLVGLAMLLVVSAPAMAHRFNVTLVIADTSSPEAIAYKNGFMLATTERDGHADEESDGHLGGLDVYVSVVDGKGNASGIESSLNDADIVAVFGSPGVRSQVNKMMNHSRSVLLNPGETPYGNSGNAPVAAFRASFEKMFGKKSSADAAQGYNAARRIDVAVKAQEGVADSAMLNGSFLDTTSKFSWAR